MKTNNPQEQSCNGQDIKKDICCAEALELMDERAWQSAPHSHQLNKHLEVCSCCRTEASAEEKLREVIVPVELPDITQGFETSLRRRLRIMETKANPRAFEFPNPFAQGVWIIASLTVAALMVSNIGFMFNAFRGATSLVYAKAAALLASRSMISAFSLISDIPGLPGLNESIIMSFMLGVLALAGGFFAVSWASKH